MMEFENEGDTKQCPPYAGPSPGSIQRVVAGRALKVKTYAKLKTRYHKTRIESRDFES